MMVNSTTAQVAARLAPVAVGTLIGFVHRIAPRINIGTLVQAARGAMRLAGGGGYGSRRLGVATAPPRKPERRPPGAGSGDFG
jgi:hypothetical protein